MIVPDATWPVLPVAVQLAPEPEPVAQDRIVLPGDQVADAVVGVTLIRVHVTFAPAYDQIVILGVHWAGATTVGSAFRVACCTLPPGRFQMAEPVFPPMRSAMLEGLAPVPPLPAGPVAPVAPVAPVVPLVPLLPVAPV